MKSRRNPFLCPSIAYVGLAFAALTQAADLTWDNGASTGNWNTSDANWNTSVWNSGTPDNAIFNADTGVITLTQAITAGNFTYGYSSSAGGNTTGSFSGSALTINGSLTAVAWENNGPGGPTLSFSNNVTVGGDLSIGRRVVEITGGTFTANRIISADSWGRLLITGGTVTATNGIDDSILPSGNTMSVVLFGGSLYTPYIKTTTVGFTGLPSDGVVLSGGTLYATANSSDFIQSHDPTGGPWGTRNNVGVGTGGANINTNGYNITITKQMQDYGGAGTLTKSGAGTLTLSTYNAYTGGTTVNQGTLELAGATGGWGHLRGAITVNSGATLAITGGDGTGFGWNNAPTSLTINGGTFNAAGGSHVGFGAYMTVALNNGGTISGSGQWNGDGLLGFSSSGNSTNTINGSWVLRADNGANHTFNVADGSAAVDLQVNADLSDQSPEVWWVPASNLVKTGAGTMVLSGNNSYNGSTIVSAGQLIINGNVSTSVTTVQGGAALGGSGTVGAVTVQGNGVLALGNSPGTLTFTGDLTLDSGSISNFEINSFSLGNYDLALAATAGTQNVTFNGTLNLLFQSGFNTVGTVKIFDFDGYSGAFTSFVSSGLANGYSASFDNLTGVVTVVPEPSAALIRGIGLLALCRRRRI